MDDVLSLRTLNRTLLERQFLTERTDRPVPEVVERLVALQGQEPNWPHLGLWARVAGFRRADLGPLLADGRLVRSLSLRGTQHLSGGADLPQWRTLLRPVLERLSRARHFAVATEGLDPDGIALAARELLAEGPLPRRALGQALARRRPGRDGRLLAGVAELRVPMVHGPETSAWGSWGTRPNVTLALAGEPAGELPVAAAVLRYLAAFGPAGVRDFQSWSGLTRTRAAFEALRPGLRVYRDERGTELFDLPDAPLADPERPVPVRFLPAYDNLLLGHADRTRVVADVHRPLVMPGRALVRPTFLLDGSVAGTWAVAGEELRISPFAPLPAARARAVTAEAERLAAFLGPEWRVALAAG